LRGHAEATLALGDWLRQVAASRHDGQVADRIRRILAKKLPDMLDGRLQIWL
jgi:hypothetical protein